MSDIRFHLRVAPSTPDSGFIQAVTFDSQPITVVGAGGSAGVTPTAAHYLTPDSPHSTSVVSGHSLHLEVFKVDFRLTLWNSTLGTVQLQLLTTSGL